MCIVLQYARYRHIASGRFKVSGLLMIKIIIRTSTFLTLLLISKALLNINATRIHQSQQALFIIKTVEPNRFSLTEDDRIYMITRVPAEKYKQIEILLFNPLSKQYFQYIPSTSTKTFLHLLTIERPPRLQLYPVASMNFKNFKPLNRIEFFEFSNNQWNQSNINQDKFELFNILSQENSVLSPFLLHYLLILILALLALDIGIKYRILKI